MAKLNANTAGCEGVFNYEKLPIKTTSNKSKVQQGKPESEGGRIIYVRRHRIIHKMQDNHLSLNASSDCCEGIGVYLS